MANIYDVARRAKVSVATVSAVVNGSAYVSPQLKGRVETAVRALGYEPNLLARSLAKQQSHTLGMIVPDIANPFWPEVVRGAEDRAHAAGYTILLSNSDDDAKKEARYLGLFLAKRVDGILIAKAPGALPREVASHIQSRRIPVVHLLRDVPGCGSDAVLFDDEDAAFEAVSHVARLGARRIAILSGPAALTTAARRLAGYRRAVEDAGLTIDPSLHYEGDFQVRSGYDGGLVLLKQKPDALFIANYLMAVGFMKAMRQYQLRCPVDVAIVTCDDHPWLDSFSPRLTTVNFPKYELGSEAARVLIERIDRPAAPPQRIALRSALAIRESCGYHLRALAHS
jgi:LacI family transcriptional regulator